MKPGNQPSNPDKELRRLVDDLFADRLSRTEFAQLEERLEKDAEARQYYLEMAAQEALMGEAVPDIPAAVIQEKTSRKKPVLWALAGSAVAAASAWAADSS